MREQNEVAVVANVVAFVANNLDLGRVNVVDRRVREWVSKDDDRRDLGHSVRASVCSAIVYNHATLRVSAEDDLGVWARGNCAFNRVGPFEKVSMSSNFTRGARVLLT